MLRGSLFILLLLFQASCVASSELSDEDAGTPEFGGHPDGGQHGEDTPDAFFPGDGGVWGQACDPVAQDCPEGGKCVPNSVTGDSNCVARGEERPLGDECSSATQCVSGATCASLDPDDPTVCAEVCHVDAQPDGCSGTTRCILELGTSERLGLCSEPPEACSIYDQDCADEDDDCILTNDPDGNVGTFCGEAGNRRNNEPCGDGNGRCAVSKICVTLDQGTQAVCLPVCRPPSEGPEIACPDGLTCTGQAATSGVTFCK